MRENIGTPDRQKRDVVNASTQEYNKQTQNRYRKRCLDTQNASRQKYNSSTKTRTSPELVSPNVCIKQAFRCTTDKGKIDRKNSKSRMLHSDCQEKFASENVPHKKNR